MNMNLEVVMERSKEVTKFSVGTVTENDFTLSSRDRYLIQDLKRQIEVKEEELVFKGKEIAQLSDNIQKLER